MYYFKRKLAGGHIKSKNKNSKKRIDGKFLKMNRAVVDFIVNCFV